MNTKPGWGVALAVLAVPLIGSPARAEDYVEDARTARGVVLRAPRTTLGECLKVLSDATGVSLGVAPGLAEEPLTAYIPRRPLRETMRAFEEAFDAVWKPLPGKEPGYRLDPDPAKAKELAAARAELLKRTRKVLDDQATEAMRRVRAGEPIPASSTLPREMFPVLVWSQISPAERDKVLLGEPVTFSLTEERARVLYDLAIALAGKEKKPQTGPALASLDLNDRNDLGEPWLRARLTVPRDNSIVGAIAVSDFRSRVPRPKVPDPPAGGPAFPAEIGENGRFNGTRDEVILALGQAGNVAILSRHRGQGGTISVGAGGRPVGAVLAELAAACDAQSTPNSRGYQLIRSLTEPLDAAGYPPRAVVQAYIKARPAVNQPVPLATLARLATLTPLQLKILQHSGLFPEEALRAHENYVTLRFYNSLSAEQKARLYQPNGLDVTTLNPMQLHILLDDRRMRGDWEVHSHLQEMKGVFLRFTEKEVEGKPSVILDVLKGGATVQEPTVIPLPTVDPIGMVTAVR